MVIRRQGPWHEVRHAIAARGEARPHAAADWDGQPYLSGVSIGLR